MPTMKDIAREAGVSHGTVSNVLNKTGKVSAEKIRLVEEAAKRLGYKPNTQAQQLRQGSSHSICVMLPSLSDSCCCDFYQSFYQEMTGAGYDISVDLTFNLPEIETKLWDKALSLRPDAIVCASCLSSVPALEEADCPVLFLDQSAPRNSGAGSASFDFSKAGSDIAGYVNQSGFRRTALFTSSAGRSRDTCFSRSLTQALAPGIEMIHFTSDEKLSVGKAFDILCSPVPFELVVTDTLEKAEALLKAAQYRRMEDPPQILTLASLRTMPDCRFVRYELNYQYLGQAAAAALIKHLDQKQDTPVSLSMANSGFRFQFPQLAAGNGDVLQILSLESPASTALTRLLPDFERRTGIRAQLTILGFDELYDTIRTAGSSGFYDLIRMDTAWLSHLAHSVYLPLDFCSQEFSYLKARLTPEIDSSYFQADGTLFSLPFDPSVQMLYYRKDLFADAMVRRQYYEQYREELEVPRTFEKYNRVASFFTRSHNPSSPTSFGTTLTFGTAGVAAGDFLPRLFERLESFFDQDGQISLCRPEAIEALESYIETYRCTNRTAHKWWAQSIESFSQGDTAMTITFSNHASLLINSKHSNVVGKVGCAMVPGGHPLTGGGVIGISQASRKVEASLEFLKWVYSDETAQLITLLGGTSPNRSVYSNAEISSLFPWLAPSRDSFSHGTRRKESPRYRRFNEKKFENILGLAVRNAVTGVSSPEEALRYAQAVCENSFLPEDG